MLNKEGDNQQTPEYVNFMTSDIIFVNDNMNNNNKTVKKRNRGNL